ncbi:protein ripply2.1-like [Montipora capricornis]|uniref:protein ripply2.1-like n=1 Tax=Montipora capricornis TaxID=246305 RepID=UPI0035F1CED9
MLKICLTLIETPECCNENLHQNTPRGQQRTLGNTQQNPQFKHPVRLLWTKAAYDYMYSLGETLLRNFPVQATIQVVDYPSDSSDEEEEDRYDEQERGSKMSSEQEGVTDCAQCEQKELKS